MLTHYIFKQGPSSYERKTINSLRGGVKWAVTMLSILAINLLPNTVFSSPDHYYWHDGDKILLEKVDTLKYLLTDGIDSEETLDSLLKEKSSNVEIQKFTESNLYEKNGVDTLQKWAKIEGDSVSKEDFTEIDEVVYEAPYFDSPSMGLSHAFNVKLKDESDTTKLKTMTDTLNVEIVRQNNFMEKWYILSASEKSAGNALDMANYFYESNHYETAQPSFVESFSTHCVNDDHFNEQWNLKNTGQHGSSDNADVKACDSWSESTGSSDIKVAVVDQGLQLDHDDLNTYSASYDAKSGTSPSVVYAWPPPSYGYGNHGTPVGGISGAKKDNGMGVAGIAPDCPLMSVSVDFYFSSTPEEDLADALNWAWQNGADVINNSWGGGVPSTIIDDAISNALSNGRDGLGSTVVFSAGNDFKGSISYPANSHPDIIATGAVNYLEERANFSNYGDKLDVVAPGVEVPSTDHETLGYDSGDYTFDFGGTSAAAPHVSGVAALILSENSNLTHKEVSEIIKVSAQKIGDYDYESYPNKPNGIWHEEVGYGMLNANSALSVDLDKVNYSMTLEEVDDEEVYKINDMTRDNHGNSYVTGKVKNNGIDNAYLAKYNEAGEIVWSKQYGSEDHDEGRGIAHDYQHDQIYITGVTENKHGLDQAGFLIQLENDGTLNWEKKIGPEWINQDNKKVVPTDVTVSSSFPSSPLPVVSGYTNVNNMGHGNVAHKISPEDEECDCLNGFAVRYSQYNGEEEWFTYLGGSKDEKIHSIAVQNDMSVVMTGYTESSISDGFETKAYNSPIEGDLVGQRDAFMAQLNYAGQLEYKSYIGFEFAEGLDIISEEDDNEGKTFLTGYSETGNFDHVNPWQSSFGDGEKDAFLMTIDDQVHIVDNNEEYQRDIDWSTYYGNEGKEEGRTVAFDDNAVYMGGVTNSNDLPGTEPAFQEDFKGTQDGMLFMRDRMVLKGHGTYLGTPEEDEVNAVTVDDCEILAGGNTLANDFPAEESVLQTTYERVDQDFVSEHQPYLKFWDQNNEPLTEETYFLNSINELTSTSAITQFYQNHKWYNNGELIPGPEISIGDEPQETGEYIPRGETVCENKRVHGSKYEIIKRCIPEEDLQDYDVYEDEELPPSATGFYNDKIFIKGEVTIEGLVVFDDGTEVLAAPCASLIIEPQGHLEIIGDDIPFHGCNQWGGIKVLGDPNASDRSTSYHGKIETHSGGNFTISDAMIGVYSKEGGIVEIENAEFQGNHTHLAFEDYPHPHDPILNNNDFKGLMAGPPNCKDQWDTYHFPHFDEKQRRMAHIDEVEDITMENNAFDGIRTELGPYNPSVIDLLKTDEFASLNQTFTGEHHAIYKGEELSNENRSEGNLVESEVDYILRGQDFNELTVEDNSYYLDEGRTAFEFISSSQVSFAGNLFQSSDLDTLLYGKNVDQFTYENVNDPIFTGVKAKYGMFFEESNGILVRGPAVGDYPNGSEIEEVGLKTINTDNVNIDDANIIGFRKAVSYTNGQQFNVNGLWTISNDTAFYARDINGLDVFDLNAFPQSPSDHTMGAYLNNVKDGTIESSSFDNWTQSGIEIYNPPKDASDYLEIKFNKFENNEFGITIAQDWHPQYCFGENDEGASFPYEDECNFHNDALEVDVFCNEFFFNDVGIFGSGNMGDQAHSQNPYVVNTASNAWYDEVLHSLEESTQQEWDILWQHPDYPSEELNYHYDADNEDKTQPNDQSEINEGDYQINGQIIPSSIPNQVDITGVNNQEGCWAQEIAPIIITDLTKGNEKEDQNFSTYPNPFQNKIHISLDGAMLSNVTLTDMQGRKVLQKNMEEDLSNYILETGNLKEGFYLLRITTKGNSIHTEQVVKE